MYKSSKYSHNVIKTTTVGTPYKGKVPIEKNVRRKNVTDK
jgi:hypothetical protein